MEEEYRKSKPSSKTIRQHMVISMQSAYRYRSVPSKCPSPCKRPPLIFVDSTVHVFICYTYRWLLRGKHPPQIFGL